MTTTPSDLASALLVLDATAPFELRLYRPDLTEDDVFLEWASQSALEGFRIESDVQGVVTIMSPTGWASGPITTAVTTELVLWARAHGGHVTDSSAMYRPPGLGRRVPDAAWISQARLRAVPPQQRTGPLAVAPEFVIEVRSPTDRLDALQQKMQEWVRAGVLLGLLLDPLERAAYVFRPGQTAPELPTRRFSGEPVLPGFSLDLEALWAAYDEALGEDAPPAC